MDARANGTAKDALTYGARRMLTFRKQRRLMLSASIIACHGRVQREGEVIHVITDRLEYLSSPLRSVGDRDEPFPLQQGRSNGVTYPAGPDPRKQANAGAGGKARAVAGLPLAAGIKVPTRDFR